MEPLVSSLSIKNSLEAWLKWKRVGEGYGSLLIQVPIGTKIYRSKKGSLSIKNMNASGDDGTSCLSKSNVIMGMYMTKILE